MGDGEAEAAYGLTAEHVLFPLLAASVCGVVGGWTLLVVEGDLEA